MPDDIQLTLRKMIKNWDQMKRSSEEQAEEDANLFEDSFYELIERLRQWIEGMKVKPNTLEDALSLPEIDEVVSQLPSELYLNFETELDLIIEGITRKEDAQYD
ncbi:hypothetical protein ACQCN2_06375 [Brevibacillus ginsengisoli]|uniref:hypothetical protein n=1 Tax=Brevibacillus ginsengisoli TaxID=363854 RepID=UPI003CE853DF